MKLEDFKNNSFTLKHKLTIYIPSTKNKLMDGKIIDVQKINNKNYVNRFARMLSSCFGGATTNNCNGYFVGENNRLDIENTTLVYSFCSANDIEKYLDEIIASCKDLKRELSQESIAVEIDNCLNFI